MRRTVFNEDHEAFRQVLRDFIEAEVVPHYQEWYEAGIVPRDLYYKLAGLGLFGIEVPEEYGGAGIRSFKYSAIEAEELHRAAVSFGGSAVHAALCLPYLLKLGTG
jgi:alkylation response protein AidB-like acyl-CoA dehydrogenase